MIKNTAGQVIGAQMITAADGSAFTGSVTASVTGDGGTQATGSVGSGACTHEGNGFHTYAPAQAETNYDHVAFTFTGTGAIPTSIQVYPSAVATGTGPNTITVTVTDGTDPLQNASVRLTEGSNTYTGSTNASGEATFNVDDATYTVAVSKSGYTFTGTTLVVSADATQTYSLTALSITASSAGRTTGYYDEVLDEQGNDEAGVVFSLQCTAVPTGSGLALDTKIYTQTSVVPVGSDPPIEYPGLIRGAEYQIGRGNGTNVKFTAPDAASFALPSVKGAE